jgi:hypothetical protein
MIAKELFSGCVARRPHRDLDVDSCLLTPSAIRRSDRVPQISGRPAKRPRFLCRVSAMFQGDHNADTYTYLAFLTENCQAQMFRLSDSPPSRVLICTRVFDAPAEMSCDRYTISVGICGPARRPLAVKAHAAREPAPSSQNSQLARLECLE